MSTPSDPSPEPIEPIAEPVPESTLLEVEQSAKHDFIREPFGKNPDPFLKAVLASRKKNRGFVTIMFNDPMKPELGERL